MLLHFLHTRIHGDKRSAAILCSNISELEIATLLRSFRPCGSRNDELIRGSLILNQSALVHVHRIKLLPGLDEGGALAQPFQFFCAGIGTGAAYATE